MRYFYMGSGLRWLVSTIQWPDLDVYKDWMSAFTTAFKDATRGTRFTDLLAFLSTADHSYQYNEQDQATIPRSLYDQLYRLIYSPSQSVKAALKSAYNTSPSYAPSLPAAGHFIDTIARAGIKYSTHSSAERNSLVMFTLPYGGPTKLAGRIEKIFYHQQREGRTVTVEPFMVVKRYITLSLDDARFDPFRCFPGLDTELYYDELESESHVIRLSNIHCHFAKLSYIPEGINKACIVARSLDRVSLHIAVPFNFAKF